MNSVLVWVLIVSSWNSTRTMVQQLGPYSSQLDCQRVQHSAPVREFTSECVQVRMPTDTKGF